MQSQTISITFLPYLFAIFGALLGIVWQNLNRKIDKLEKNICDIPTTQLKVDIADIKNDLQWIKKILQSPKV